MSPEGAGAGRPIDLRPVSPRLLAEYARTAPPSTPSDDDEGNVGRGLGFGLVFAIGMWGGIIVAIWLLLWS